VQIMEASSIIEKENSPQNSTMIKS